MKKLKIISILLIFILSFTSCSKTYKYSFNESKQSEKYNKYHKTSEHSPISKIIENNDLSSKPKEETVEKYGDYSKEKVTTRYMVDKKAIRVPDDETITSGENRSQKPSRRYNTVIASEREDRKVIRAANMDIVVKSFEYGAERIEGITKRYEGIIANKNYQRSGAFINGSLTIWVPAEKLIDFSNEVAKVGTVLNSNIESADITDQYYDLDAHLRILKKKDERLFSLYSKSASLDDILTLERELSEVRTEIEQLEGKKRRWSQLVKFSTVSINLTQDVPIAKKKAFEVEQEKELPDVFKPIKKAYKDTKYTFYDSSKNLVEIGADLYTFTVSFAPLLPIILVIALCLVYVFNKIKLYSKKGKIISKIPESIGLIDESFEKEIINPQTENSNTTDTDDVKVKENNNETENN